MLLIDISKSIDRTFLTFLSHSKRDPHAAIPTVALLECILANHVPA